MLRAVAMTANPPAPPRVAILDADRFAWARSVGRDVGLPASSKHLAWQLACTFFDRDRGAAVAGLAALMAAMGLRRDAVCAALDTLERCGWIARTKGGGRGKRTAIRLLNRADIVPFPSANGRAHPTVSAAESVGCERQFAGETVGCTRHKTVGSAPEETSFDQMVIHPLNEENIRKGNEAGESGGVAPTTTDQREGRDKAEHLRASARHWAASIRDGRYVGPNCIKADVARFMIRERMVTEAELRQRGVAW